MADIKSSSQGTSRTGFGLAFIPTGYNRAGQRSSLMEDSTSQRRIFSGGLPRHDRGKFDIMVVDFVRLETKRIHTKIFRSCPFLFREKKIAYYINLHGKNVFKNIFTHADTRLFTGQQRSVLNGSSHREENSSLFVASDLRHWLPSDATSRQRPCLWLFVRYLSKELLLTAQAHIT